MIPKEVLLTWLLVIYSIQRCAALQGGLTYTYRYSSKMTTGIPEINDQISGIQIKCLVDVEVDTDRKYYSIQLHDVKYGTMHGADNCHGRNASLNIEEYFTQGMDELLQPYSVYFTEKGVKLMMPETYSVYVTNIKKAIVSLLHLKPVVDPSKYATEPTFADYEETPHGFCENRYHLQPFPGYIADYYEDQFEYDVQETLLSDKSGSLKSKNKFKSGKKTKKTRGKKTSKKSSGTKSGKLQDSKNTPKLSDTLYTLDRTINFDNCNKRITLQDFTLGIRKPLGVGQLDNIASRSSVLHATLRGDENGFRIEKVYQEGALIINPFGYSTEKIVARTNHTLRLISVGVNNYEIQSPSNSMIEVNNMYYEVLSPYAKTEDVHEKEIHYLNTDPKENGVYPELILLGQVYTKEQQITIKKSIVASIKTAAEIIYESPNGETQEKALHMLHLASYNTFYLTKSLINELFEELYDDKTIFASIIRSSIIDILAAAGSGQATRVLIEQFRNQKITDIRMASVFMTLTNSLYDPSVVSELMQLVMDRPLKSSPIVNSNLLVNFATIAREVCLDPAAATRVGGPIFSQLDCKKDQLMEEFLHTYIKGLLEQDHEKWEEAIIVQALVNLKSVQALQYFEGFILNSKADLSVRLRAIKGLHSENLPITARDHAMEIMNRVFYNISEINEIREKALLGLVSWKPDSAWWQYLASSTWSEPSNSLKSFVYSLIQGVAQRKIGDCDIQQEIASHVLIQARPEFKGYRDSEYHENHMDDIDLFNDPVYEFFQSARQLRHFCVEEITAMFSSKFSFIPSHYFSAITTNFGEISMKSLGLEITLEGIEKLVSSTRSVWGYSDNTVNDPRDLEARIAKKVYGQIMDDLYGGDRPDYNKEVEMKAHILFEFYENMQIILPLDNEGIVKDDNIDFATLALELSFGRETFLTKYMTSYFVAYALPSDVGLPFVVQHSHDFLFFEYSYATVSLKNPSFQLDQMELNVNDESNFKYKSSFESRVNIMSPFDYYVSSPSDDHFSMSTVIGAGVSRNTLISLPVHSELNITPKDEDGITSIDFKMILVTDYQNEPKVFSKSSIPMTYLNSLPIITPDDVNQMVVVNNQKEMHNEFFIFKSKTTVDEYFRYDNRYSQELLETGPITFYETSLVLADFDKEHNFEFIQFKLKISPSGKNKGGSETAGEINQYDQYSQYDQYDQSSFDYDRLDEYGTQVDQLPGVGQLSGTATQKLEKLQSMGFDDGYVSIETILKFSDGTVKNFDVTFARGFYKGENYAEKRYRITALGHCLDITRIVPEFSNLESLEDLAKRDIRTKLDAHFGICDAVDKEYSFMMEASMSKDHSQYVYDKIINNCEYDENNPMALYAHEAHYDRAKLDIIVKNFNLIQELTKSSMLLDMQRNCQFNNGFKIHKEFFSQAPYKYWQLDEGSQDSSMQVPNIPLMRITYPMKYASSKYNNQCIIKQNQVRTFDGFASPYHSGKCYTVATMDCSKDDGWVVMIKYKNTSPFITIISPTDSLVVHYEEGDIKANGKIINPIGESDYIKSRSGKILGKVQVKEDTKAIIILGELRVVIRNNQAEISVANILRSKVCGICGNRDGEVGFEDFMGPHQCTYDKFEDLVAAWSSSDDDECDEYALMEQKMDIMEHQETCDKPDVHRYAPAPQQEGVKSLNILNNQTWIYPIRKLKYGKIKMESEVCVAHEPVTKYTYETSHYPERGTKHKTYQCWYESEVPKFIKEHQDAGYVEQLQSFYSGFEVDISTRYY